MASTDLILGLSINDRTVQAVEVERGETGATLMAIDEWANTIPADSTDPAEEGATQFGNSLSAFRKVNRLKARKAAVAIDTTRLFLHVFPLEEGLGPREINDHITWELNQYFPEAPSREFVSDIQQLAPVTGQRYRDFLSVSVRRKYARLVRKILAAQGLEIDVLDADHFSADTALRVNYPDTARRYLALVGIKETRLDVSLIRHGNMENYTHIPVQSDDDIINQISRLSRETQGIYSITAYGPHLDKDLLAQIRRGSTLLVEALNPLRHVHVADSVRLADHLSVPSYRFASAVGVALRRD
jgi:Tfp pilus assembly PilM family ATPase